MVGCRHNEERAIKLVVVVGDLRSSLLLPSILFESRFYPRLAILHPGFVVGLIFSHVTSRHLMRHEINVFQRAGWISRNSRTAQRSRTYCA